MEINEFFSIFQQGRADADVGRLVDIARTIPEIQVDGILQIAERVELLLGRRYDSEHDMSVKFGSNHFYFVSHSPLSFKITIFLKKWVFNLLFLK